MTTPTARRRTATEIPVTDPWTHIADTLARLRRRVVDTASTAKHIARYGDPAQTTADNLGRALLAQHVSDRMVTACEALIEFEKLARREAWHAHTERLDS